MELKPAISVHLYLPSEVQRKALHEGHGRMFQIETEEDSDTIATALTKHGVHVVSKKAPYFDKDNNESERMILNISMTKENATRLSEISDKGEPDEETVRTWGELSGFPQTAIDTYVHEFKNNNIDSVAPDAKLIPVEQVSEYAKEDHGCLTFRLSKEHWQEELKTVQGWCEAVKEHYPELYKRIYP